MLRLGLVAAATLASGCGLALDLDPRPPPSVPGTADASTLDAGRMRRDGAAGMDAAGELDAAPLDGDVVSSDAASPPEAGPLPDAGEDAGGLDAGSPMRPDGAAGVDAATPLRDAGGAGVDAAAIPPRDAGATVDAGARVDAGSGGGTACNPTTVCSPTEWCDSTGTCGAGVCRGRPTAGGCTMTGSDIYCGCDGLLWSNVTEAHCAGTDVYSDLGVGCCWTDSYCTSTQICVGAECATRTAGRCVPGPTSPRCLRNADCGSGTCVGATTCGCVGAGCTTVFGTCVP